MGRGGAVCSDYKLFLAFGLDAMKLHHFSDAFFASTYAAGQQFLPHFCASHIPHLGDRRSQYGVFQSDIFFSQTFCVVRQDRL